MPSHRITTFPALLGFFVLFLLCGCGGSGGTTNTPTPTLTASNPAPVLGSISPTSVTAGAASVQVTVNGTGFIASSTVEWNGTPIPTTYVSATQLTVNLAASSLAAGGTAQVSVMNAGPGGGTSSATTFTINNPAASVTSVSPSPLIAGSGASTVTVTGAGFLSSSTVQWNGSARPTTFVSATQLQAVLTAADLATGASAHISVVNPAPGGGTSSMFAVAVNNPAPVLTTTVPSSFMAGSGASTLTLNGSGFNSSSVGEWNGAARPTTFVNSTQLQVALTASDIANGATVAVSVLNPTPGGGTSAAASITINNPSPTVSAASPNLYVTDQATNFTVTGTGFVPSSVVQVNSNARSTTFVSATQVQATLTAADLDSPGIDTLSVVNPAPAGGTSNSLSLPVNYATPAVTRLSPSSAIVGSADTVVSVYGFGFAPVSVVMWNAAALSTQYVNSGLLRATVPAADLASIGTAQMTVTNPTPGGGVSSALTFTIANYLVPVISNVYPSTILVNSADTQISVTGTNFYPVSTIQVNGTDLTTAYHGSYLTAIIPASYFASTSTLQITVDTAGGGTSNALQITVSLPLAPTLTSINPTSAALGASGFTLTVVGSNFTPASVVRWNGSNRATTYVSGGQLTAAITSADIATFASAQVTVYTPAPGGGTSTGLPFFTYLPLAINDFVYNPVDGLFYASIPSTGGPALGNSIVSIDPNTGTIGAPIWVGSEPNKLALSSDGRTLWVGLDGAAAVRKVDLTTQLAGLQFSLGGGNGVYNSPNIASAIAVLAGSPDTVAVGFSNSTWWNGGVAVFDSGVPRSTTSTGSNVVSSVYGLAFSPTGTEIYAAGNGYEVLTLGPTGITNASLKNGASSQSMAYDSGKVYLSSGLALDAETGSQLGVFSVSSTQTASGPIAVDSALGRAFMYVSPNYSAYQINAYDLSTYVLTGTEPLGNVASYYQVKKLVRWGQDGLAFSSPTQLFVMHSTTVRDLSSTLADLSVNVSAPSSASTGSDVTYTVTVANNGPADATPASLIDTLPNGAVLKSATTSQGSCAGTSVVRCDLGTMSSAGTATVTLIATQLTGPSATNTAMVSSPEGDGNLTNNTSMATVTISGNDYTAVPQINSVSPELVAAGSAMFTLTVNGTAFSSAATVNWNGTALATTFVSSSQLTAQVPAADVSSLGWAWVSVTNPTPGGGTSGTVPVTTYQTVNLASNHIHFDPYTQKIYATVPSTATQVTGNSIVAIDPNTGTIGTPLPVGSEPTQMSESDDGKYLYIGLNGSKSLTRVDLTSMTQGSVYPLNVTQYSTTTGVAARWLDVMPGNDNTLAIDTGSYSGIGLFDISGTTGAFRSALTGPYTGSTVTFANANTVYSYDSDTSGAMFNRWSVGANGLTLVNASTITGMGGFSGSFQLVNGIVYGGGGGVADPTTAPATQLGRFMVNLVGLNQSFEPTSLAADPAGNRVFFAGTSTAGTALPFLASFDASHYTLVDTLQLPGQSLVGTDLQRWGRDGLALQMPPWASSAGSNQIILLRGPWVLPEWGMSNPVPVATSSTPSSTSAGSGNLLLSVTGSNFVPGAVVLWNGAERTTTYIDSSHLQIAIPASDVSAAGTVTLTITNPGTAASGGITFTVN